MYVRLPKTGSTTITSSFRECVSNTTGQRGCLRWLHNARPDITAGELEEIWRTYFVFTFTRNVWTRAVSQWQVGRVRGADVCGDRGGCGRGKHFGCGAAPLP